MSTVDTRFSDAMQDLARFLSAIRAYLDHTVLCGGWVPWFYRHMDLGSSPDHGILLTYDFDLALPRDLPVDSSGSLHENLIEGRFVQMRNREPPVVYYQHERWGTEELAPVFGELLTSSKGSTRDKSGSPKIIRDVQPGVTAQELRYLDLLLYEPLRVPASQAQELSLPEDLVIQIPNPATFILQKALALKHRNPRKRAKDLAYVFEVAATWFYRAEHVGELVASIDARSPEWSVWVRRGSRLLLEAFASDAAEGPAASESLYRDSPEGQMVSAASAALSTRLFLSTVFASL